MCSVKLVLIAAVVLLSESAALAQRPMSPRGEAAVQLGGEYQERRYVGGQWVTVDYGRPILRGRTNIFGAGDAYGKAVSAGAPVWRAGANKSTRFMTEADLNFGDNVLPAGEYSLFVDLKEGNWTLILSTHTAKDNFRDPGDGLWGADKYTADRDVLRVGMDVGGSPVSYAQFTVAFLDMTKRGGKLALMWEKTMATAAFSLKE